LESEGPEYAPDMKWKVTNRADQPRVFTSAKYTLSGKLKMHVLANENGPVRYNDWKLRILVAETEDMSLEERLEALKAMQGREVYYVENFHSDDGDDHTEDIQIMFLQNIGEIPEFSVGLERFYLEVQLLANHPSDSGIS
jgi:hypothetical protein